MGGIIAPGPGGPRGGSPGCRDCPRAPGPEPEGPAATAPPPARRGHVGPRRDSVLHVASVTKEASMQPEPANPDLRLRRLERQLRLTQAGALAALVLLVGVAARQDTVSDDLRTHRLKIVDDAGVVRMELGQDPKDSQRRSRACGLTIFDTTGNERGGMGTMDDLSAVMALDAPLGVGSPMRDRAGIMVSPDGSAQILVIDNTSEAPVRLFTEPAGGGGLELSATDAAKKLVRTRRCTAEGDQVKEAPA